MGKQLEKRLHINDEDGILLEPEKGELAVLNPAVYQDSKGGSHPFSYRTIRKDNRGEYSTIDFRVLETPTRLSKKSRKLIYPKYSYESMGCEDPRLTKKEDTYFITYVAYDGLNARIALATTKDFQDVNKLGTYGPELLLEEAIDIVGNKRYKSKWQELLDEKRKRDPNVQPIIWDKDGAIYFINGKWVLYHRLEPDIHIAIVDKLDDLKDQDFWRDYLRNIDDHTLMIAKEPWEIEKIGIGPTPLTINNRQIGIYHGVSPNLEYSGSFFETDPLNPRKVISKIPNPLFTPNQDIHVFEYEEDGETKTKRVVFPTGAIIENKTLWVYSGIADEKIHYRSTCLNWLQSELTKNKIQNNQ